MVNKKKILHIIGAFSFIILTLFTFFSSGENLISLVKMEDKIIFSGPVFMLFFAFPFLSYFIYPRNFKMQFLAPENGR